MIKKGVISNIIDNTAEVIIPEYDNAVTPFLPFAKGIDTDNVYVGDKCVLVLFDSDNINLANGAIIAML